MKLLILVLMLSSNVFASDNLSCTDSQNKKLTYNISEISQDLYELKVTKAELVPYSCRSRWGCDYEQKTIWKEKLKFRDWQGVAEYSGKFTTIVNGESADGQVEFSHTGNVLKDTALVCTMF